ncbi:MAG: metallophosphoesterase [Deltaproteobacteria bacterium]|nr:metallophosphoesterase [Deltaproteobacteria bacterium]
MIPSRLLALMAVLTTVTLLVHGYLGARLIGPSGLTGPARTVAWAGVFGCAMLMPVAMSARFWMRPPYAEGAAWVGFVAMGLFSVVLTLTVLRDLGWLLLSSTPVVPADPERRFALLRLSNTALLGLTGIAAVVGTAAARKRADVVDVKVPIKDLSPALEGFTIVQLSDVHVGPTIKKGYIDAIVDAVNELSADAIAITGDLVDGSVAELSPHTAPLGRLKARHGVYFCTGNHDYYSGALPWIDEVRRLGMQPLLNEHVVIVHNGARVVVAGVNDYTAEQFVPEHRSDPKKAVHGAPADAVKILLAHQPRSCADAAGCGYHLQLSGHTHGGQIFPWMFFVQMQQPYVAGLDRHENLWVYTSRGTGYWGPPLRLGAPSEITRLTLVRA